MINVLQVARNAALLEAVSENDIDLVAAVIRAGADIDTQDADGCTPAMLAVQAGNFRLYKFLVNEGADLEVVDSFGNTIEAYAPISVEV